MARGIEEYSAAVGCVLFGRNSCSETDGLGFPDVQIIYNEVKVDLFRHCASWPGWFAMLWHAHRCQ